MDTIERLKASDMEELLDVLNVSFTGSADSRHFENGLPRMWIKDDEHMGKHFAVRSDGKIVAALGIYPLPAVVAGEKLLFSTVGNVATLPEARGGGCMKRLMDVAMAELDRIGADASRLGGLRSRYARFGYENSGTLYNANLTVRNVNEYEAEAGLEPLTFRRVESADDPAIADIRALHSAGKMYVERGSDADFFLSLRAWSSFPWAAFRADGSFAGYIDAPESNGKVAEYGAKTAEEAFNMLCCWLRFLGSSNLRFSVYPWDAELCRLAGKVCENLDISCANHFKIISWDKVTSAFLKLRAGLSPLSDGEFALGIEGWGTLSLGVSGGETFCRASKAAPDLTLSRTDAARLLFGPLPASLVTALPVEKAAFLSALLPLPLSWNGQDRV